MAVTLKNIEKETYSKDMKFLENLCAKKGKAAGIFRLREKILGKKKSPQEKVVLIDPETGDQVTSPSEIKRVSLAYLTNLLTKKHSPEIFVEEITAKRNLHFMRMEERVVDDIEELSVEIFEKTPRGIQ